MLDSYNFLLDFLRAGDSVVVACSGGPDSMALLSMILDIRKKIDIEVICAHVNHNVRVESDSEKVFVESFCRDNGVLFEYMKINDYSSFNFEGEAREKRYSFFSDIVFKHNSKYLLTAHHGDDLIETILMRIDRGSSLKGYSGFSRVSRRDNYMILRPFICVSKDDILKYDSDNNISYVIDKTNMDDVHTRNRYRKLVVPFFKDENKDVHRKFYDFSRVLIEYNDYVDRQVDLVFNEVYVDGVLFIDRFLKLDAFIKMRVINVILCKFYNDDLRFVSDKHVHLIYDLICSDKVNSSINLPCGVLALKSYNEFMLSSSLKSSFYDFVFDDFVSLPNGKSIEKIKKTSLNDNYVIRLSSADICLPLRVRTRRNGDKMFVKGLSGSKKIKDIFIDSKVSFFKRDEWPIVVDSRGVIVWLPGLKKSKFDKPINQNCDIILRYY